MVDPDFKWVALILEFKMICSWLQNSLMICLLEMESLSNGKIAEGYTRFYEAYEE